jgi:hypothetical protein
VETPVAAVAQPLLSVHDAPRVDAYKSASTAQFVTASAGVDWQVKAALAAPKHASARASGSAARRLISSKPSYG